MNKLERCQAYANKCADKMNISHPVVKWSGTPCIVRGNTYAHCHVRDEEFPRGTICLNPRYFAHASVKQWHHTIAHEVCHLVVKSNHHSPTFDRRLVALGVANCRERVNARSARKGHHHIWMSVLYPNYELNYKVCRVCGKHIVVR